MARLRRRAAVQSDPAARGYDEDDTESDHSDDGTHAEPNVAVDFDTATEFASFRLFTDALRDFVARTNHRYVKVDSLKRETFDARSLVPMPASMGPYKYCVVRCHCGDGFRYYAGAAGGGAQWVVRISLRVSKPCSDGLVVPRRRSQDLVAFFESYLEALDEHDGDQPDDSDEELQEDEGNAGEERDADEEDTQEDVEEDAGSDQDQQEEDVNGSDDNVSNIHDERVEPSDEEEDNQGQHSPDLGLEPDDDAVRSDGSDIGSPDLLNLRPPRAPSSAQTRGRAQGQGQAQAQGLDHDVRRSHANGKKKKAAGVRARRDGRGRSNNQFDDGSDGMEDDSEAVDQANDDFVTPDRSTKRHAGHHGQDQAARRGANGTQDGKIVFTPEIMRAIAKGKGLGPAQVYISSRGRRNEEER